MPPVRKLVDVELVVVEHLNADATLDALVDGVATELPRGFPKTGRPRVQVFRASSTEVDAETGHIERAVLQVNGYGSSKGEAWDVIAETLRSLREAPTADHDGAVVTAVERLTGPSWSPDPTTNAPRYTASVAVTVHPI